jgi:hypothetical protein
MGFYELQWKLDFILVYELHRWENIFCFYPVLE